MIMRTLVKILFYCKTNDIDIFTEGDLFKSLTAKEKYLPIQMFLRKFKLEIYKNNPKYYLEYSKMMKEYSLI